MPSVLTFTAFCRGRKGEGGELITQEESHSGGTSVEFYTNVTLLSTLMSQRWQYATSVTLMVVTVL